jgi:hypothetical protein
MDYLPHELRAPVTGILGCSELRVVTALEGSGLTQAETAQFGSGLHKMSWRDETGGSRGKRACVRHPLQLPWR